MSIVYWPELKIQVYSFSEIVSFKLMQCFRELAAWDVHYQEWLKYLMRGECVDCKSTRLQCGEVTASLKAPR